MYVFLLTRLLHIKGGDYFFLEENISYHPPINKLFKYGPERDLKKKCQLSEEGNKLLNIHLKMRE